MRWPTVLGLLVRYGQVPPAPNTVLLLQEESASLRERLWHFFKMSNNHGMECLLKRLRVQTSGVPGSFANGARAVQNFLATQVGENILPKLDNFYKLKPLAPSLSQRNKLLGFFENT